MRASRIATAMLAALLLGTASAAAAVNVTFVKPEKYRDDDFRNASKREGVMRELTRHFERLDKRYLTAGEKLEIAVLDARLAGRYERWQPTFNDAALRDPLHASPERQDHRQRRGNRQRPQLYVARLRTQFHGTPCL